MANVEVFRNVFYGDYKCSGSGEVLEGLCYCVGEGIRLDRRQVVQLIFELVKWLVKGY